VISERILVELPSWLWFDHKGCGQKPDLGVGEKDFPWVISPFLPCELDIHQLLPDRRGYFLFVLFS
jgi:hypothetical protein